MAFILGGNYMTLKQLEYFLAIAETGNITKAANNICISEPPLSLQLKSLEDELGVQLFIRDKKSMVITKEGLYLQKKAKKIIRLCNETIQSLQASHTKPHVTIHIGTVSSICNSILPAKILSLKKHFSYIDFDLHESNSISILKMLDDDIVDFGIIREPFSMANYNVKPIKDTTLGKSDSDYFYAIALSAFYDDPKSPDVEFISLKDKPIISHRRYYDLLSTVCRQQGFTPNIVCQNDNISSSLSWASSGIGIAIAPYTSAIQNKDPDLLIKRIKNPTISSSAYIVWKKGTILSNEKKEFLQLFE
jgi:DNA-binding transcriptional LysR family regulator